MPTIFDRLQSLDATNGWRVYFHDIAHSASLARLWHIRSRFSRYATFHEHAALGALPSYSFIEPDFLPYLGNQNDQHPPTSVAAGERLIADVYNSLRQGPAWKSTLLVVIFDEHGGCYDHVAPPVAVPPSRSPTTPFNFDRYGVRVPALLISPYIPPGLILRPQGPNPFDHTSVIATLRKRFNLGPPLGERDAEAPTFDTALSLPQPTNMGPARIDAPDVELRVASRGVAVDEPLTDLQASLVELSRTLPDPGQETEHIRSLEVAPRRALTTQGLSPLEAGAIVDTHVKRFLGDT
jgi:phospholipase C